MERDRVELLRLDEAAKLLNVKESTLRAWRLRRKNLPFVGIGRCVRVPARAVEEFIKRNTVPAREQS
jgi:excisionase family DNA binding protein